MARTGPLSPVDRTATIQNDGAGLPIRDTRVKKLRRPRAMKALNCR